MGEMFCPIHLVIGKMEKLDVSEEITAMDNGPELAFLPVMANITIPLRSRKVAQRTREKMRIDEPLDNITHQEHLKFEQLCLDFRDHQDQLFIDDSSIFPEDKFLR